MCGGIRVELMLYIVLMFPFESVVLVLVFFGFVFWSRKTIAASSSADLTSAIQYSFSAEGPDARSVKFSAVRRWRCCGSRSLGVRLRSDCSCSSMASCSDTVMFSEGQ